MVGLSGGGGDWFWGESPVGGLNSGGRGGVQIADFSLSIRGMQGVTDRNSLNWLCPLYRIYVFILRLMGFRQYLRGSNRGSFLCVDLPGS